MGGLWTNIWAKTPTRQYDDGLTAVCKIYLPDEQGESLREREVRALRALSPIPNVSVVVEDAPIRTASGKFVLLKTPFGFALQYDALQNTRRSCSHSKRLTVKM